MPSYLHTTRDLPEHVYLLQIAFTETNHSAFPSSFEASTQKNSPAKRHESKVDLIRNTTYCNIK